jgi:nitroreductase
MSSIKTAKNEYPILDIIKNRWSPRAFSNKLIEIDELNRLFEASRWAASANNEQPWQYIYAINGSEGFNKIWDCLMAGNQPWAKNANIFVVSIARKKYELNNQENPYSHHDLGMANANLMIQALSQNIYCHPMAGFKKAELIEKLNLTVTEDPVCIFALGYLADPETLEEPFKTRELTERKRKTIGEFVVKL